MIIGIDVESGEKPFQELVQGVIDSSQSRKNIEFVIVGNSKNIKKSFPKLDSISSIGIVHADEIVYMDEKPVFAVNRKRNCTVNVGIKLLREGKIDAFFSPGNTGATVVSSVINLGLIETIKKPALATFFPRVKDGETLILDVGANPDANVENLWQNAIMGLSYYRLVCNKKEPTVGLLNMGGESEKGSILLKKAFVQLSKLNNFIGNVEGYNVFNGSVDVVVCNGFTGNAILKIAEATKRYFLEIIDELKEKKSSSFFRKLIFSHLEKVIFSNEKLIKKILPRFFGAAPILGIKGLVMVGHGACSKSDLINAIDFASFLFEKDYLNSIIDGIKKS